ncbi:MAG: ATP-binding protein [Chthoniobacterales bacterium]
MKIRSLRARVALWTVAIVCGVLVVFGAGAAWNLRKALMNNLDLEIGIEGRDLIAEIEEQPNDWTQPTNAAVFFAQESKNVDYLEVRNAAGQTLYRSANLGETTAFPARALDGPYTIHLDHRRVRFRVFQTGPLRFALGKDSVRIQQTLAGLASAYFFTLPFVLVAVGGGGWWIARRASAPVQTIAAQAEKISAAALHQRLPPPEAEDEIGHLTLVLNRMFDRLERSFEQVTRFTSDASHELKTPMTLMRAELETALESGETGHAHGELLSRLLEQCFQLTQIVDGLLFLSRADDRRLALDAGPVDLVPLLQELREDAEILAAQAGLGLDLHLPKELFVPGDARLLRRAAMNLIDNALKYNQRGGSVVIRAEREGRTALLTFRNTGPVISGAEREKVFERFFRSDGSHNKETSGHGLGLSITREIAHAHQGEVTLARSDSEWTEFWFRLPIARNGASPRSPEDSARPGHAEGS